MIESNVRALQPADAGAARALVVGQFSGTRYEARTLAQLDIAVHGDDAECRGLVVSGTSEERLRGLALVGSVAGAQGVVKIHALVGRRADEVRALVRAATGMGARMVVCEMADDAPFRLATGVLREFGFKEEGRVADFVCDGMGLLILTWQNP